MSLRNLHRITCSIFPSACGCKPDAISPAVYCSPVKTYRVMKKRNNKSDVSTTTATTITTTRQFSTEKKSNQPKGKEKALPQTMRERLADLWKNHKGLVFGTYVALYATTLGSIYVAIDLDLLNSRTVGLDPAIAVNQVCNMYESITGSPALPNYIHENPSVGTLAIAYVVNQFIEPLRIAATLGIVPVLINKRSTSST